jgi:hypothetical protein
VYSCKAISCISGLELRKNLASHYGYSDKHGTLKTKVFFIAELKNLLKDKCVKYKCVSVKLDISVMRMIPSLCGAA